MATWRPLIVAVTIYAGAFAATAGSVAGEPPSPSAPQHGTPAYGTVGPISIGPTTRGGDDGQR